MNQALTAIVTIGVCAWPLTAAAQRSSVIPPAVHDALVNEISGDIAYEHIAELGGLRGKSRGVPDEVNDFWTNRSFHRYADYALSPEFRTGLDQLIAQGHAQRCAIMCSEAVWWRCHRRIVSDYLIARGEAVFHIMGEGRLEPARLTPGAVVQADGSVVYPAIDSPPE